MPNVKHIILNINAFVEYCKAPTILNDYKKIAITEFCIKNIPSKIQCPFYHQNYGEGERSFHSCFSVSRATLQEIKNRVKCDVILVCRILNDKIQPLNKK